MSSLARLAPKLAEDCILFTLNVSVTRSTRIKEKDISAAVRSLDRLLRRLVKDCIYVHLNVSVTQAADAKRTSQH